MTAKLLFLLLIASSFAFSGTLHGAAAGPRLELSGGLGSEEDGFVQVTGYRHGETNVPFTVVETEKTFRLPILDDPEHESIETVELILSPAGGTSPAGSQTLFAIHDDEVTISEMQLHHNDVTSYVSFTFNSVPDRVYRIDRSTNLKDWQSAGELKASNSSYRSRWYGAGLSASSKWFYRVRRQ